MENASMKSLAPHFESILDTLSDGVFISDVEGTTLFVNKMYETLTGLRQGEIRGKNIRTLVQQGTFDKVVNPQIVETGKPATHVQQLANGKRLVLTGHPVFDDKGQLWMHAKAFEAMCATGTLPCNVKFMLEGEEEIGSASLYAFCEQHRELLKADIILVSDTSMLSMDTPSITCGLRGLAYMEVEVTGPDKDLHSGLFGGAVANPANVLARLVAGLVDENGRVTIPGFYDDVRELTPAEREAFNKAPFSLEDYKKSLKIGDVEGEAGYTTLERTGVRPSLDVNGIWGGYIEEGTKTIIPSKASAKISMRLVPNQDYRKISELFEKHFRAIAPESVKVVVKSLHGGMPYVAPTDMPAYKAAEKAVEATFGKKPLPFYSGGSIPIISGFESILGIKSLLIGFGLAEDAIHSPNESYGLEQFDKGVETIPLFYKYFAESE